MAALEVALDEGLRTHLSRLRADGHWDLERALATDLALLRAHPEALMGTLLARAGDDPVRAGQWRDEQRKRIEEG